MVLQPSAPEAARAAAECETLSIGLHFVDDGSADLDDPDQAARSFHTQLRRFRELTAHDPSHVDSHHHVHTSSRIRRATFAGLVEPLGVPLRGQGQVAYVGGFWAQWETGVTNLRFVRRPFLLQLIRAKALDGFTELACHPARINGHFSSRYLHERAVELETLTEPGLRDAVGALGVELVSFHSWTGRQGSRRSGSTETVTMVP